MLFNLVCKQIFYHIVRNKKILFKEKKKMLKCKAYNPSLDYPLLVERLRCKKLCYKYNTISPEKIRMRSRILDKILGKTGKVYLIEQPFMCDYGYNIEIGENFGANHNLLILDSAKVVFGDNVMVGPNCSFITTKHPTSPEKRKKGIQWAEPIIIGDNSWICSNVTVLAGVKIGNNSIIGAGSIVTKDIPQNSFAIGTPCKVVREINNQNLLKQKE